MAENYKENIHPTDEEEFAPLFEEGFTAGLCAAQTTQSGEEDDPLFSI